MELTLLTWTARYDPYQQLARRKGSVLSGSMPRLLGACFRGATMRLPSCDAAASVATIGTQNDIEASQKRGTCKDCTPAPGHGKFMCARELPVTPATFRMESVSPFCLSWLLGRM